VNRTVRALLTGLFVLGVYASSFAQLYPVPAKTPNTVATCAACGPAGAAGQTVGYTSPLTTYTGRFLDSTWQGDWFRPFRTARAYQVLIMPSLDRIYFRYGNGTVAAYQLSTFFARLEASEPLTWPSSIPVPGDRSGNPEKWLAWASWFNPEMSSPSWQITQGDGSIRMPWFDVDDRGYVYIASTVYGWGLAKDDLSTVGNAMRSVFQKFPSAAGAAQPSVVAALKSGTRYYAYLSGGSTPLWDVTTPNAPVPVSVSVPPLAATYAKNSTSDRFATIDTSGKLSINSVGSFVSGSAPLFTAQGYSQLASDGTNFFALQAPTPNPHGPGGISTLDVYSGSGTLLASNPINVMITSCGGVVAMRVAENVIVMSGLDASAWDMQVYKLSGNYVPTRLPINSYPVAADANYPSYFRNYYVAPPTGYTVPTSGSINVYDGTVYKAANGNLYLIFCGKGLGDVYQLQAGDSISPTNDGAKGSLNAYAPPPTTATVFYGDPVQFTGKTQSQNVTQIVWDLGNPEAGTTTNTQYSGPNAPFTYQYSNLTKATIGTRTVKASSATDSNVRGSVTVTLAAPAARFGILQTAPPLKFLFAAPNASSPAPIIAGDSFIDASDGSIESHYVAWNIDGTTTQTAPNTSVPVGQCGVHSLFYQTFYGPYTNLNGVFATQHPASPSGNPGDYIVGLNPANPADSTFTYVVKPFAAVVDIAGSDATNVNFTGANSRGITSPTVAASGGLTWTWDVITPGGGVVFGPASGIQTFPVPRQTFVGQPNLRVRLTLQTVQPIAGTCAGLEKSVAITAPINAPDPTIATTGGGPQNLPYTFTASSATGLDTTGWTYKWTVNGASSPDNVNFSATSMTGSTFSPSFLKTGSYSIVVTATNAIASVPSTAAQISVTVAQCVKLASNSFLPSFSGATSNCGNYNGSPACQSGESVTFTAQVNTFLGNPYNPSCSPTTYVWKFPDGTSQTTTDAQATKTITTGGSVTLTVSNATGDSFTYSVTLTVGSGNTGNPCAGMSASNIFPAWTAPSCPQGGTCKTSDTLSFRIDPYNYPAGCFNGATWNFGDGTATGLAPSHKYATDGVHNGSVTVTNTAGDPPVTRTFVVTTQAGTTGGCGTMTNSNVFVNVAGASCTNGGTLCSNNDALTLSAVGYQTYDFSCAQHTYNWDFGDGSAHSTDPTPTHAYANSGMHNGSVLITNQSTNQQFTRTFNVTTQSAGGGTCAHVTPNLNLSITYSNGNGTCGPLGGSCAAGEAVNFSILTYQYDIGCAQHTYDWNFGDGTAHSTDAAPTHQYAAGGTYHATCVVNNGSSYTLTQDVVIGNSNPGKIVVQPTIAVDSWTGVPNGFIFTARFDHPEAVTSWAWNFGDGTTKTVTGDSAANPAPVKYAYSDNKHYEVTLTTYASNGQPNGTENVPNEPTAPPKRRSVKH